MRLVLRLDLKLPSTTLPLWPRKLKQPRSSMRLGPHSKPNVRQQSLLLMLVSQLSVKPPWLLLMRLVQLVVSKSNRQLSMWSVARLKSQPVSVRTAGRCHVLLAAR